MTNLTNFQRKINNIINGHNSNLRLLRSNCDAYKRYIEGEYDHSIREDIENNLFFSGYGTNNGIDKIQMNLRNTNFLSELKVILNESNQLMNQDKENQSKYLEYKKTLENINNVYNLLQKYWNNIKINSSKETIQINLNDMINLINTSFFDEIKIESSFKNCLVKSFRWFKNTFFYCLFCYYIKYYFDNSIKYQRNGKDYF